MRKFKAARLKAARIAKGMSPSDLYRELVKTAGKGSRQVIKMWEGGKHTPGGEYMLALSKILGKPVGWFYE